MRWSHFRRPLVLIVAAFAGALAFASRSLLAFETPPRLAAYARIPRVVVEGRIASHSVPKRGGERFWIVVDKTGPRVHGDRPVRVLAYLSRKIPGVEVLRPGQRVRLSGRMRRPFTSEKFDEAAYMARRRAAFVFYARAAEVVDARIGPLWKPLAWGETAHRHFQRYAARHFSPSTAAILEGLLLGYKGRMSPKLSRAIQDAGVMHLLTPSGAKITILWVWALGLGMLAGLGPHWRWTLAAAVATAYLCVVGFEPPYTRAYLMGMIVYAGRITDRRPGPVHAWAGSALLSLLFWPQGLFAPGFQMTYLAMFGILLAVPRWGASPVVLTVAVQTALVPPMVAFFGMVSLSGLFVNLLCVPASTIVAGMGFLGWALDFHFFLETVIGWFVALCRYAASRPWAVWSMPAFSPVGWACYYAALVGIAALPAKRAAAVCLAAAGLAYFGGRESAAQTPLRLQFRPWGVIVGAEGKDVYCVRTAPSGEGLLQCPQRKTIFIRETGPLRVYHDGGAIKIQSERTGDTLGGFVS